MAAENDKQLISSNSQSHYSYIKRERKKKEEEGRTQQQT